MVGVDRLFRETLKLFLEADGFTAIEAKSLDDLHDRMPLDGGQAILIYSLPGDAAIEQDLAASLRHAGGFRVSAHWFWQARSTPRPFCRRSPQALRD